LLAGNSGGTLTYINSVPFPPATDNLTLQVNDLGQSGTGGPQTGSASSTISIVNAGPPTIAAPGQQTGSGTTIFSSANGNASRAAAQYGAAGHDSSAHDASARVTANGNGRHVANGVPTYVTPSNGSASHMPTANAVATHGVISNSSLPGITAPVIRRR